MLTQAIGLVFAGALALSPLDSKSSVSPPEIKVHCQSEAQQTNKSDDEGCNKSDHLVIASMLTVFVRKLTPEGVSAAATVVIAAFTVILVLVTNRQAKLTRKSVALAREEFIATHRPRIIVHASELTRHENSEIPDYPLIGASLLCFNIGESVAKNVEVRGQIYAGLGFAPDVMRPVVRKIDEVLSGQKLRAEIESKFPVWTAAAFNRTEIEYYCLGWISYFDEHGQRRETGFCLRAVFDGDRDRWISAGKPEYEYEY